MNVRKMEPQPFVLETAGVSILRDHTHVYVMKDIFIYKLKTSTSAMVSLCSSEGHLKIFVVGLCHNNILVQWSIKYDIMYTNLLHKK